MQQDEQEPSISSNIPTLEGMLDLEELRLKQKRLELLRAKKTINESDPISNFVPHAKQDAFFRAGAKPRRGVFSGNRFGKSTAGVIEDLSWARGYRAFYPTGDPARTAGIPQSRGVKILVIGSDWEKVREIFTEDKQKGESRGKFFRFCPPELLIEKPHRNQNGVIDTIYITQNYNGFLRESVIKFDTVKSFMNDPQSFESADWDAIHGDEPFPKELWTAASRGLIDRGGHAWFLLTALSHPWIYRMFQENKFDPAFWSLLGDMDDNPLLSEESKRLFFSELPEDEKECRKSGIPLIFSGLVYNQFDDVKHVKVKPPYGWVDMRNPPADYLIHYAIDPHPQTPHAVLFAATAPSGETYLYSEIFDKCSISDLVSQIKLRLLGRRVGWQLCDPIAWIVNPENGRCWADSFHDQGLAVIKASKQKTEGILVTKEKFYDPIPMLFVMKHMKTFLREIGLYHYVKDNKTVDKDDHLMECLYRLVMQGLNWWPDYSSGSNDRDYNNSDVNYNLSLPSSYGNI